MFHHKLFYLFMNFATCGREKISSTVITNKSLFAMGKGNDLPLRNDLKQKRSFKLKIYQTGKKHPNYIFRGTIKKIDFEQEDFLTGCNHYGKKKIISPSQGGSYRIFV